MLRCTTLMRFLLGIAADDFLKTEFRKPYGRTKKKHPPKRMFLLRTRARRQVFSTLEYLFDA